MLEYFQRDERPYWVATVEVEGQVEDLSSGYTFRVAIGVEPDDETTPFQPVVTKTTGITGGAGGVVTVAWAVEELDLPAGDYVVQLTATRVDDDKDWTIEDRIRIKPRMI